MAFELNEEILKKALLLELEERVDAYTKEYDKPHVFSKRFNLSMWFLKKYRKISTGSIR